MISQEFIRGYRCEAVPGHFQGQGDIGDHSRLRCDVACTAYLALHTHIVQAHNRMIWVASTVIVPHALDSVAPSVR